MVQVVTGDSQEEVIIFRDTQTDTSPLYIYRRHHPHNDHRDIHLLTRGRMRYLKEKRKP